MSTTRDQFIETTCALLETQGYHGTGLNQIVAESGSPKGSLYYYFPDGKEGLAAEAIQRTGELVLDRIQQHLAQKADAGEAVEFFLRTIAHYVEASDFKTGAPLTGVAIETAGTSERLSAACSGAFQKWQAAFKAKLVEGGFSEARAESLATLILSSIEGATLLSRTYHRVEPLERVAVELRQVIDRSPRG